MLTLTLNLTNLVMALVLPIALLWLLYVVGIQAQRGGWWRLLYPVTLTALLLDWALNYTLLAVLMWDWPRAGERTFSQRVERLIRGTGWRREFAAWIAITLLDPFDPGGSHIKP